MVIVDAAKRDFRIIAILRSITEVEGDDGLRQQALINHIVEGWDHEVHGVLVEAQTKDAIPLAVNKLLPIHVSSFCKILHFDRKTSHAYRVLGDIPRGTVAVRSVIYLEMGTILLVR